jgi:hypothetical protein
MRPFPQAFGKRKRIPNVITDEKPEELRIEPPTAKNSPSIFSTDHF